MPWPSPVAWRRLRAERPSFTERSPAAARALRWAALCAVAAVIAGGVGATFGNVRGKSLDVQLIGGAAALAFLILGAAAVRNFGAFLHHSVVIRSGLRGAAGVRVVSTFIGYVLVLVISVALLNVPIEKLAVGGALTGVVLGIAAQQSLGNVFAGIVLIAAHPFVVGDRVRVRSGALGGPFEGTVRSMDLTYVTFDTDEGLLHVPNSGVLAAAVGSATQGDVVVTPKGTPVLSVERLHRHTARRTAERSDP
jgi:small-conductance mechanosensitive channel